MTTDASLGLTRRLAACFQDGRQQVYVDHSVRQLVAQRIYGLALGYEDLNDHERLRLDPLPATACDKRDTLGGDRFDPAHRGVALAGASTLNRLELSNHQSTRAHKLAHAPRQIETRLLQLGARCLPKRAAEIVVDLDAMGHRLHGRQEGRHFSACDGDCCYLPLYVFAGDFPLWAQLRPSDQDGADGAVAALEKNPGPAATLPPGAHHCARRRRFLPGRNHGLVRGSNERLLLSGPGQELRAGGAFGAGAGDRANAPVSVRRGQRAGVHGV